MISTKTVLLNSFSILPQICMIIVFVYFFVKKQNAGLLWMLTGHLFWVALYMTDVIAGKSLMNMSWFHNDEKLYHDTFGGLFFASYVLIIIGMIMLLQGYPVRKRPVGM